MRGCLFVLALAGALAFVVALVGLRPVAAGVVHAALVTSGLGSDDLTVTVEADPPTDLLGLHADAIDIRASRATWGDARIGRLAIRLEDVALAARSAERVEGRLDDVVLEGDDPDEDPLQITVVHLAARGGPPIVATAVIDAATMEAHVRAHIEAASGIRPGDVRLLEPDVLRFALGPVTVAGRLAAGSDGSLVLRLDSDLLDDIVLVEAGSQPIRFTGVRVVGRTLELVGETGIAGF